MCTKRNKIKCMKKNLIETGKGCETIECDFEIIFFIN